MTLSGRPTPLWGNLGLMGSLAVFVILLAPELMAQNWMGVCLKIAGLAAVFLGFVLWQRFKPD